MEAIKAGTRCECRNHSCPGSDGVAATLSNWLPCKADAVLFVYVPQEPRRIVDSGAVTFTIPVPAKAVPMCAACAEYHEGGAK
jgi:hypothetical protein